MKTIIKRLHAHGSSATTSLALFALASSFLIPVFNNQKTAIYRNPLFWFGILFFVIAVIVLLINVIRKPYDEIPSIQESARNCDVIWGMWWSGDRQYKVMNNKTYAEHFKRILLPDIKSVAFTQMMTKAGVKSEKIVPLIKRLTKLSIASGIDVKWFGIIRTYALTIYDPKDMRAYVIKQDLGLGTKREYRKLSMFRLDNEDEMKNAQRYQDEFEQVWKHPNTRTPQKEDYE